MKEEIQKAIKDFGEQEGLSSFTVNGIIQELGDEINQNTIQNMMQRMSNEIDSVSFYAVLGLSQVLMQHVQKSAKQKEILQKMEEQEEKIKEDGQDEDN